MYLYKKIINKLIKKNISISVAESCTGGSLAENLTRFPGSSSWFDCGFITYSNQSKQEILSVSSEIIEEFGAVSEEVALEMAKGALEKSPADYSVSITGISGPDGGSEDKLVGTVCIAWYERNKGGNTTCINFEGDRQRVREQSSLLAMQGLLDILQKTSD